LRQLKKIEASIRFGNKPLDGREKFVWDIFFSTRNDVSAKYPVEKLLKLDHLKLKEIINEYYYEVYYQSFKENGFSISSLYDSNLLSVLGLQPGADLDEIKKRYRELALKYHPDKGGDSDKFIELFDAYKKLMEESI
jgi:hypothetical protein